ncbi:MAG: hypothetical protein JXR30_03580, partial [Alphaproteobacteria bacterium]|nr:hypothetical protein [Alphaproteobacteria bacterium]
SLAVATGLAFSTPAQAMNTENPLYMPQAGNFFLKGDMNYSNLEEKEQTGPTGAISVTKNDDFQNGDWSDSFLIGYGFSDKFAMTVSTETPIHMSTKIVTRDRPASPVITGIFRAVKKGNVILDVMGSINPALQYNEALTLGAGIRAGVITKDMTLALGGYVGYGMEYDAIDQANGDDLNYTVDDNMAYMMTADLQFNLGKDMSLNLGGKYFIISEQGTSNNLTTGEYSGYRIELGLNMELKKKLLVTPYLAYSDVEQDDLTTAVDGYEENGMEYGIRFGMEF